MNNEEKILKILENLTNKFDSLESQVQENTQILKALEHKVDIVKAEQDNLTHQVASLSGSINSISDKLDKLSKDLTVVEAVTGKNMQDIAYLKAIK